MKRKRNTRDYHKVPRFEDGGEVTRMTQEEKYERGVGRLRERLTRNPDTDYMAAGDISPGDRPTHLEQLRRENDSERATAKQLRQRVRRMDKPEVWDEAQPVNDVGLTGRRT